MASIRDRLKKAAAGFAPPALYTHEKQPPTVCDWEQAARGEGDRGDAEEEMCKRFAARNVVPVKQNKTSRYTGVHRTSSGTRWEAQMRVNGRIVSLGKFLCERQAARARDIAVLWSEGREASARTPQLNFSIHVYEKSIVKIQEKTFEQVLYALRRAQVSTKTPATE